MNRREFAEYFEIPYRTVQEWELGHRKMPEYLLRLMAYKVQIENENGILNVQRDKE
jgi:DNA-binding transcriptional regulator YiaG